MPFQPEDEFYQARVDPLYDDNSWGVWSTVNKPFFCVARNLKSWQATALARTLNGERPRAWYRRKDEKKAKQNENPIEFRTDEEGEEY
jgi:hypothetical protein